MALAHDAGTWLRAARLADLEGEGPHSLSAGGVDLVALRTKSGALKVFDGRCPHQGALLGEGELEGQTLVCRNHRWAFDRATGQRVGGRQCLKACPSRTQGNELFVDTSLVAVSATKAERGIDDLPGPKSIPLFGNALQIDLPRLHLQLEGWHAKYGSPFTLRLMKRRLVVIANPTDTEAVLRARPNSFRRVSMVEKVFTEMSLEGVFSAEGEDWRSQRRLTMEALSQKHLRGFYPMLDVVATRLVRRWEKAADAGTVLDIADELKRFTVDVTTQLVFGHDIDTLGKERGDEDLIQAHLEAYFPAFHRRLNSVVPYWRWFRLPVDRRVDRAIAGIEAWIGKRVKATRALLEADPSRRETPSNLIEAMLVALDAEGLPFTDRLIHGNALTMLLAGEDTTAYSLAWAVHLLCDDARATAALRAELDAVLGERAVPRDLDAAGQLPYATGVAQEAMRLRPVVPVNFLEALHDVVIAGVGMPKGTNVAVLSRPPTLEDARFHEAHAFVPERWIPGAREGAHEASAHIPFGSGPRICPGRSLALLEMRVVLAALYRSFEVERVGCSEDVQEHAAFTVVPTGLRVRLRRRAPRSAVASREASAS